MIPRPRPRQAYLQRLDNNLPQYLAEFDQPLPLSVTDFSNDGDMSDRRLQYLYEQTTRKRTLSGTRGLLVAHFFLGRALATLGTRSGHAALRRWTTPQRARHVYRAALRVFEVFDVCGPEYIFVSSLSPTVLREMTLTTFDAFLSTLQTQVFVARLTEQTPLEGDNVTVHDGSDDLHPRNVTPISRSTGMTHV